MTFEAQSLRLVASAMLLVGVVVAVFACDAPSTGDAPKSGDDDDIEIPADDDDDPPAKSKKRPTANTTPKTSSSSSSSSSASSSGGAASCHNADTDLCLACCLEENPGAVQFEEAYSTCLNNGGDPDQCKSEHLAECAADATCMKNHDCLRAAKCILSNGCE